MKLIENNHLGCQIFRNSKKFILCKINKKSFEKIWKQGIFSNEFFLKRKFLTQKFRFLTEKFRF